MAQNIREYPDPALRMKSEPVERITKEILDLIDEMIEIMTGADGVGLAANQVGITKRIFVLNTTPHEEEATPIALINPRILESEGTVCEEEGCLSFPELYVKVERSDHVSVYAKNHLNEDVVYEMTGLLARAIQHEIDHLNGVLLIDHIAIDEEKEKADQWLKLRKKEHN